MSMSIANPLMMSMTFSYLPTDINSHTHLYNYPLSIDVRHFGFGRVKGATDGKTNKLFRT